MKVLITGANGFIGTHLCRDLSEAHHIFALTRSGDLTSTDLSSINADLSAEFSVEELPAEIDVVLHLAQSRQFREFPSGVVDTLSVNTLSTARLLNYALESGCKQFIFASTGSVYSPRDGLLNESMPVEPSNSYAISKYAAELVANCYCQKMKVLNLRIFFPYGPGQDKMFIPNLVHSINAGKPVMISGDSYGLAFCPLYISDLSNIIAKSIEGQIAGTLNLGGNERITLIDAANLIANYLGVPANIEHNLEGKPVSILSDNSLIEKALDTKVTHTVFADGIKKTIDSILG
ncbi:MAG: NAD(P)-dependent oxidoreductase [Acidiferrobacterales bacterium]|nr:NAD(P)-dependent oxidoreductase [Acidiferrobacterales bacterium]